MRSGQGNPDEARAARYILKDYVNGKLLFCHSPPGVSEELFNQRAHEHALTQMTGKKRAPVTRVGKKADTFISHVVSIPRSSNISEPLKVSSTSQALDNDFFASSSGEAPRAFVQGTPHHGREFIRGRMFPHQNVVGDDGRPRPPDASAIVMEYSNGKKRHKKMKRMKQRSGKGYDVMI